MNKALQRSHAMFGDRPMEIRNALMHQETIRRLNNERLQPFINGVIKSVRHYYKYDHQLYMALKYNNKARIMSMEYYNFIKDYKAKIKANQPTYST